VIQQVIKEVGVPQEMYDSLKQKLIEKEGELKRVEESIYERDQQIEKLKEQYQSLEKLFDEKMSQADSEIQRHIRDSYEREKGFRSDMKTAEEAFKAELSAEQDKINELKEELVSVKQQRD
jgi:DNA phosphorothioation-dependent restriction protein DptG